jgi:hypothetical protein
VTTQIGEQLRRAQRRARECSARSTPSARGLNISCRRVGRGLRFTLRPSARGTKLRQLIGPKLSVGFVNPGNKSTRINTTYRFK